MTTRSSSFAPPIFTEADMFDGTNYFRWRDKILRQVRLRAARGYLYGTIKPPTISTETTPGPTPLNATEEDDETPIITSLLSELSSPSDEKETPWASNSPSWTEWDTRDAWVMSLICDNVKDPIGLGVKTDGTAADAWRSLEERYKLSNDLARVFAQRELRGTQMGESDDFLTHIADLQNKYKRATEVGAVVSDTDFREIILASLPSSWDTLISTLHMSKSSQETIINLEMHWSRINRGRTSHGGNSTLALKATRSEDFNRKQCKNCKRRGHEDSECYWPGGGKEGQFPPNFGNRKAKREGTGTTGNTNITPVAKAAIAEERVLALSAKHTGETVYQEVQFIIEDKLNDASNDPEPHETVPPDEPGDERIGDAYEGAVHAREGETDAHDFALVAADIRDKFVTLTYADSGANNHCFANKTDFSNYEPFETPRKGQAATRGALFKIVGKGKVTKTYEYDGIRVKIIFSNALHTPDFEANLVSISQLDAAGLTVTFKGGYATILNPSDEVMLRIPKKDGMYVLTEVAEQDGGGTIANAAKSLSNPTTLEGWHLRFCHFGERTIKDMQSTNLVDGLQILPGDEAAGRCEDCVYGKHAARPYDGEVEPETDVLERVHVDLWGPARVTSAGGARYAMFMTDGGSSYRKDYYLKSKSDALQTLKDYKAEAELQTGKKLKRLRFDMGKEFLNRACEEWCRQEGIVIEPTGPYSPQSNGVAERTNRTIFEGVRAVRCDCGLPASYWPDITRTVVYVRNLMPSRRHPGIIPAERWENKRQDVSHLRRIGSTAYAQVPKETNLSKLDAKSIKYTLIGYYGREAYKLLDRSTGTIIKSRNVIFEEGEAHRTTFDDRQLYDDPIFEDEITYYEHQPTSLNVPDTTRRDVENAQAPVPRDMGQQATPPRDQQIGHPQIDAGVAGAIHDRIPVAPRHRPDTAIPQRRPLFSVTDAMRRAEVQLPPRRSGRVGKPTEAAQQSKEFVDREKAAMEDGEEWAQDGEAESGGIIPGAFAVTHTIPALDMELEVKAFQAAHMENFQADLDEYIAMLAESATPETYLPRTHAEAMEYPDLWLPPMQTEMEMMAKRGVFSKVSRPAGHKIIGLKWVYGFKYDGAGQVTKRKARLVAQGFNQIPGVDFDQTYASVARLESMRMCLAIIAHLRLRLWQIDFVAAYLNSLNKFEVYTTQAPGFVERGEEDMVYRAHKTVYGMMAGAHDWEEELSGTYDKLGYYQSKADPCVRHRKSGGEYTLNVTYTDDVIGGSASESNEEKAIGELGDAYEIKRIEDDEEKGRLILGMNLRRDRTTGVITLSQRHYLEQILERHNMMECNPKATPLPVGITLSVNQGANTKEDKEFMAGKPYREVLGSIMWAQVATRPDLSFAVNLLARFQINPGPAHWHALMHVLAYIKHTLDYKISYAPGTDQGIRPYGYVDADYAGDLLDTGRSTSGYVFMMAGGPVSWSSKRQESVSVSTTEAEYIATSQACQQMMWMYSFMREAGLEQQTPGILFNDNTGAIALTKNKKGHKRAKHIHVRYHYIRERVGDGDVTVIHVPSEDNVADILTKSLPRQATENQCYMLGLFD